MPGKHWSKLLKNLAEELAVEAHHCYISLIILQCKQLPPWRQLQRDQSASRNLLISWMALLDRKTSQEVLPVAGVLLPGPLVFCLLIGKIEKEKAMQEAHPLAVLMRLGAGCSVLALKNWITSLVTQITYLCLWHTNTNIKFRNAPIFYFNFFSFFWRVFLPTGVEGKAPCVELVILELSSLVVPIFWL